MKKCPKCSYIPSHQSGMPLNFCLVCGSKLVNSNEEIEKHYFNYSGKSKSLTVFSEFTPGITYNKSIDRNKVLEKNFIEILLKDLKELGLEVVDFYLDYNEASRYTLIVSDEDDVNSADPLYLLNLTPEDRAILYTKLYNKLDIKFFKDHLNFAKKWIAEYEMLPNNIKLLIEAGDE